MLFGKMSNPIEFMCKPYEACLSEVIVTHSPRYLIDMNLSPSQTIFDKINMSYDEFRKQNNSIKTIVNYYRTKPKNGDDIWWLDQESTKSTNFIIRVWNNLTVAERTDYMLRGLCFFPEPFSNRSDKFNRFALWLSTREGVVCPNVRDIFTAGGQGIIEYKGSLYPNNPQIIMRTYNNIKKISEIISETNISELTYFWNYQNLNESNKFIKWSELVSDYSQSIIRNNLPIKSLLRNL